MNWEALGAIGDFVGAVGVIVSLLYLAGQVRNNARQVKQAAAQSVLDKVNGLLGELAFTPGAGELWARGLSGMENLTTEEERTRFSSMLTQAFWTYEEVFQYRQSGVIEDWAWTHTIGPLESVVRTPGFQQWWGAQCDTFGLDFCDFLSERMPTQGAIEASSCDPPAIAEPSSASSTAGSG